MQATSLAPKPFDGSARLLSIVPGRARVKLERLHGHDDEKPRIEAALKQRKEVHDVIATPLTGSVLILFDAQVPAERMLEELGVPLRNDTERQRDTCPRKAPAYRNAVPWHLCRPDEALALQHTSCATGLRSEDAAQRLQAGMNVLPTAPRKTKLQLFTAQFTGMPVALLGVSAVLAVLTGGASEALAIVAVLLLNGGIGYATERRAEASIALLDTLVDEQVPLLRDGQFVQIDRSHIVPGDILLLAPGVHVAADARVVRAEGLAVNESPLTGESGIVDKRVGRLETDVPVADRANMVYMGTAVVAGKGLAVVIGTGAATEIGAVQSLMDATQQPKTPIQKQLDYLGNRLVLVCLAICAAVFGIGLLRGQGALAMLRSAISLAIAAVPEGLPTVATTTLARGVRLMHARHMLIRRLQAIETLGAIHTICLDKTGTLTLNRMSAVALRAGDETLYEGGAGTLDASHGAVARLLEVCALSIETHASFGNGNSNGSPVISSVNSSSTESALSAFAADAGVDVERLQRERPMLESELRGGGRNYMRTVHRDTIRGGRYVAIKGSPLEVLQLCRRQALRDRVVDLTDEARARITQWNEEMAAQQLRVLGFAFDELAANDDEDSSPVWLGLVGLADPLRPGAGRVIAALHAAGIRTAMVTGDQPSTAEAVGRSLRLQSSDRLQVVDFRSIHGAGEDIAQAAETADVFARVSPAAKLEIVQALQASGHVVAMTGDGINDGPALQAADIGIAMGLRGTELARSAADVVLTDDQLETVLEAIRQGRAITANIEKALRFLLSSNLSEILVTLGAVAVTGRVPLTPLQLLWINLLSDVLPAVALAAEPPETDLMAQPPRDASKPLVGGDRLRRYGLEGGALAAGALGALLYGLARYGPSARSSGLVFNALVFGQLLHAYACRSERRGLFTGKSGARNGMLDAAIGGSLALQGGVNLLPGLRSALGMQPLGWLDWLVVGGGAVLPYLANEAAKLRAVRRPA